MCIRVLLTRKHVQTVHPSLAALSSEFQVYIMPRERTPEIDVRRVVNAPAAQSYFRRTVMERLRRFLLHAVMCQVCVILDNYLDRRIGKTRSLGFVNANKRSL